jgi:short-subunit dehydrogenase
MGRAIALGFASRGVDLVLAARRRERLESVADDVRALGREPPVVVADLVERYDCRSCAPEGSSAPDPPRSASPGGSEGQLFTGYTLP